jgi:hypothetical protein
MKKLIVCFALSAIAALPLVAGENAGKDKAACADKAKAECPSKQAKACCASKTACSQSVTKQSLLSPKAAEAQKTVVN